MKIDVIKIVDFNLVEFININNITKDNWEELVYNPEFIDKIIEYLDTKGVIAYDIPDYTLDEINTAIFNYFE